MAKQAFAGVPIWSVAVPVAACGMLVAIWGLVPGALLLACAATALIASVLVAVHHAEMIAHRLLAPWFWHLPSQSSSCR